MATITSRTREQGLTIEQMVCHALADAGIALAEADLEDRTPRRRQVTAATATGTRRWPPTILYSY
ncbi:MAG: hypothetical protein JOY71_03650 [Acetobacteraceae bacterium]|nr:hypothetical protein [Acetobacteraceae bacterium]MBV8521217.1 hypothetical protein [Acetobacteraceae bacterium]MBV8590336.1 hypothetical protein [Acetobacteraceae bacterium]